MPAMRPRSRLGLAVVEIDGEAVIYDEGRGELHHLNPTATLIFRLCDGEATVKEFSAEIARASGASAPEVERDVRRLIRELRQAGLLEATAG